MATPHSFTVEDGARTPRRLRTRENSTFQSALFTLAMKSRADFGEEGGKDLHDAESGAGKTTTMQATSTFVTTIIGVGILGFPATFAKGGWIISPVILVLSAWSVAHIGELLEESIRFVEKRLEQGERFGFDRVEKYDDLCEAALGGKGKVVAGLLVNGYMLLISGAFIILIGDSINVLTGANKDVAIVGTAVVFLPLSLLDDMTVIANMSVIGVAASVVYAISIGTAGIQASMWDPDMRDTALEYTIMVKLENLANVGAVVAVMLLGFTYQMVAPIVRSEMAVPEEMPKAINRAVVAVAVVYGAAGVLAYYGFGNVVEGNVTKSMVFPVKMGGGEMLAGLFLASAVVANLVVTFPIFMNCVYRAAEAAITGRYTPSIRIALVALCLAIGYFLPYFFEFLTLIGALVGCQVGVFLPIAMYWLLAKKHGAEVPPGLWAKHVVILALGLCALCFGTYDAVVDLIEAIKS